MKDYVEVSKTIGSPNSPTEKGWAVVTPEMWEFRNNIADKVQVDIPDYFSDKEAYVDASRIKILADLYREDPNMPPALFVAKATAKYLDTQVIKIRPYAMLLGMCCGDEHGILFDPLSEAWQNIEKAWEYVPERIFVWEDGKKVLFNDRSSLEELRNGVAKKYAMSLRVGPRMTEFERHMYFCPEAPCRYMEICGTGAGRSNPDRAWVLDNGFRKLIDLKKESKTRFEKEFETATGKDAETLKEKIVNCEASVIAAEAVVRWIKRLAAEAKNSASQMPTEKAKKIALQAAANCEWVAENKPRTFWEAAQLEWLERLVTCHIESSSHNQTIRPDLLLWPWYKKDVLEDKTLDRVTAAEIICCDAAKMHEVSGFSGRFGSLAKAGMGSRDYSVYTLGGQDRLGHDAHNALTDLYLDVWDGYRLHYPDIKYRWFPGTKKDKFKRVCEVIRSGLGNPSIRNDVKAIETMMDHCPGELTIEQARDYAIVGCNTPGPQGDSKGTAKREVAQVGIEKTIEFALFNGRDPEPGFEWFHSIDTGDPVSFKDFDEFYQAWLKQWEWLVTTEVRLRNMCFEEFEKMCRKPFGSLLYQSCLESGLDMFNDPTPAKFSFQGMVGWVDIIDSLVAVKYWIYDKKKYSMEQLITALKADWENFDAMRKDFKEAPKYGNNDDYADDIMVSAVNDVYKIHKTKTRDRKGYPVFPNILPISLIWQYAPYMNAAPNGRKRGETLCDGGLNPHSDFDKSGSWSRLLSSLKVDQAKFRAWIYNERLDPTTLAGEAGLQKFSDFCWTAMEQGQTQMQFNFVNNEVLHDAQKHPEKYPYLTVRISGYNAFFVEIPKAVQNTVIRRVEHHEL